MQYTQEFRFLVAPMMDWTDRHCRFFHRLMTRRALLYTEMVTTGAVIHGDRDRLIGFNEEEHPVALQLGGSDPEALAIAARIGADRGYDEINLNCGCPSDRVQSGRFGACLMAEPDLVARSVAAMKAAVDVSVTVKCRIGIDDQDPEASLFAFVRQIAGAGVDQITIHARKAWLKGLSPKENRDVPPLNYDLVYNVKRAFPDLPIAINGGIPTLEEGLEHLRHVDGIMLGRAAYQTPALLLDVDRMVYGDDRPVPDRIDVLEAMVDYAARQGEVGVRVASITRHMLGFWHGLPGARAYRRHLSTEAVKPGADYRVIADAIELVDGRGLMAAE
ncbi:MAG: tRNA dihydrouridine(20/20a) synthase DusA [Pseudomonadota bacterium]